MMRAPCAALILIASIGAGCQKTETVVAPTEILLRVDNTDTTLRADMTALRITLAEQTGDSWVARPALVLPTQHLNWPVDVPITPGSTAAAEKTLALSVDALANDDVLAEARATTRFVKGAHRMLEMFLYICPGQEKGFLCAPADCKGDSCAACGVDGNCGSAPLASLEPLDVNKKPVNLSPPGAPTPNPSVDASANDSGSNSEMDASRDGGEVATKGSDAGTGDAGTDGGDSGGAVADAGSSAESGIAKLDSACSDDGALACGGHDNVQQLACASGKWTSNGTCNGDTRCDTHPGPTQGTCQPIVSPCVGKNPLDPVCDGNQRKLCDADLLVLEGDDCPLHAHCDASGGAAACGCDTGYTDDGSGGCRMDNCAANACGEGATACVDQVTSRTCTCDAGYDGTGTAMCSDIDECAQNANVCGTGGTCANTSGSYQCTCGQGYILTGGDAPTCVGQCSQSNVCTSDYPCEQTPPADYDCRGQFADYTPSDSPSSFTLTPQMLSVLDARTGLEWQRTLPSTYTGCSGNLSMQGDTCTWAEANAYCQSLSLVGPRGMGGWRLPTLAEIQSILDFTRSSGLVSVFPPVTGIAAFWTASPYMNTSEMRTDAFGWGSADTKTATYTVRCVR